MGEFRSPEDVQRMQQAYYQQKQESETVGLPPGYFSGGLATIENGVGTIGPLIANIFGNKVEKSESTTLSQMTWRVNKFASSTYYIYLDPYGAWSIDVVAPEIRSGQYGLYHPTTNERFAGTFTTDSSNDIATIGSHYFLGANDITTATLNALIANIGAGAVSITSEGIVIQSPGSSYRLLLNEQRAVFQFDDAGTWAKRAMVGGSDGIVLPDLLEGQGLIKTGADRSSIDAGDAAPTGSDRYGFNNAYTDEDSNDPWDGAKTALAFTTKSKFGSHALTQDGTQTAGELKDNDADSIALDTDFSLTAWTYAASLPPSETDIVKLASTKARFLDVQVNNGLSITGVAAPAMTALDSTTVAYADANNDELRTYSWDGTDWSQVGNGLSVASTNPTLAALDSITVAFIDDTNDELRTYSWDGTDWSQVGNGLSVSNVNRPSLAALDSMTVAFIDDNNDELQTYSWDGTDWSQVGNGLSVAGVGGENSLAALDATTVAFIDAGNDELRTYSWDGTDWSQVGNGLSIAGVAGFNELAALDSMTVAFIDDNNDELQTYSWDGTDWSLVGGHSISGVGAPAMAALDSKTVALIDDSNDELRTYSIASVDIIVRHERSGNLVMAWDSVAFGESTTTVAVSAGWIYFSIHFDTSANTIELVVGDTAQGTVDVSADTALTHGFSLSLLFPSTSYRFDDLLVMEATLLTTADSIAHYNSGYGWAANDIADDLVLLAKVAGVLRAKSPLIVEHDSATLIDTQAADTAVHVVGDTGEPAFENNFGDYDTINGTDTGLDPGFYKDSENVVRLEGLVDQSPASSGSLDIFTLPAGYRPSSDVRFAVVKEAAFGYLVVLDSGEVQIASYTGGEFVSLDGISFRAEQ